MSEPPELACKDSMQRSSGSTPSLLRMNELLTLSLRETSATLLRKPISADWIYNLVLSVMTHHSWPGEGRNEEWLVRWEFCLLAQLSCCHNCVVQRLQYRSSCADSLANFTLQCPLTCEQGLEILELLLLGLRLIPYTQSRQSTDFQLRIMASDFEVLVLIPPTSHSAGNWSGECWRSQTDGAIGTTSSANSSPAITTTLPTSKKTHVEWMGIRPGPSKIPPRMNSWVVGPRPGQKPYCSSTIRGSTVHQNPPLQHIFPRGWVVWWCQGTTTPLVWHRFSTVPNFP